MSPDDDAGGGDHGGGDSGTRPDESGSGADEHESSTGPESGSGADEHESSTGPESGSGADEHESSTGPESGGGGGTGLGAGDVEEFPPPDPELGIEEVDRVFRLLEEALEADAVTGREFERLLGVLESAITGQSGGDPGDVAELVTLLEELLLDPDDLESVDVDSFLSVFEEALSGASGGELDGTEDVVGVITEAFRDPTQVDPEDVEQFRSGIERTVQRLTGSDAVGGFLGFPGAESLEERGSGDDEVDVFRIARLAAGMTQRASGYSVESGVRTGTRMAYAAAKAQSPADLLTTTRAITIDELQRAGIDVGDEQADWLDRHEDEAVDSRPVTRERLRDQGERLLSKSAELGRGETLHPAFDSVLGQLAGDEARILRLLATEGPQPTLDVYDKRYVPFKSQLVTANLSRVGSDAGCRQPERTQLYLTNLERLGLVTFLDEPVTDLNRYQVLEAQSQVEAALDEVIRPKTSYGRLELTDFGIEFCETCLPVTVTAQEPTARFWTADN